MGDQPSAQALLQAMAVTLTDQVMPATAGGAQHSARVVANLCRVLARELASPDADGIDEALRALLDGSRVREMATGRDRRELLDERLRDGDPEFARRALPILRLDVERRLAISKPSYLRDVPTAGSDDP